MHVDIAPTIAPFFPLGTRPIELSIESGATGDWMTPSESETAIATMNLIVFEKSGEGEDWMLRDIKQQEVNLGFPALYNDPDRVAAFFAALGAVIESIPIDTIEKLMPVDLVPIDALKLKRANTQADFDEALRAKSRLGKYL